LKIILAIIGTLAVAAAASWYFGGGSFKGFSREPEATVVRLEPAKRGTLVETVSAPGTIVARSKVSISARVSARIMALPKPAGSSVKAGDVLVALDATDLEAQLRAAEARFAAQRQQITVAEARLRAQEAQIAAQRVQADDAGRELDRQKQLFESRDVSEQAVEQQQARFDQLAAQLESAARQLEADRANLVVLRHQLDAADADIARARDNLSYTTIASPIDGTVTRVNTEVGELAVTGTMNNPGTVILEVANLGEMIVNARVDETAIADVKEGQHATVRTQAYPGEVFQGVVRSVALAETEAKDGSKYYKCEVLLELGGERIFSGLTADVDIETRRHDDVLRIPSQSVLGRPVDDLPPELRDRPEVDRTRTFATVVYRFVEGKAVVTPVKVGASDVTHTIIASGLDEGDRVVVGPYKVLESMTHNQVVRDEAASTTQPATRPQ
jgi:HlyD family secretion protein